MHISKINSSTPESETNPSYPDCGPVKSQDVPLIFSEESFNSIEILSSKSADFASNSEKDISHGEEHTFEGDESTILANVDYSNENFKNSNVSQ